VHLSFTSSEKKAKGKSKKVKGRRRPIFY